ncbi:MAG: TlyA family RNA methyltransferase [Blautia sp.]|nr:TlyA family RNA methyltransferase [Blautia sp.]
MRLDVFLYQNGFARSRTHAASLIAEGYVTVNGKIASKPSGDITDNDTVNVTRPEVSYVSRGGLKLHHAIESLQLDVHGMRGVDIGASTGGFTDCLLAHGAEYVVAVDAGSGQLDKTLVQNDRVLNIENCNARYLTSEIIGGKCDIAVTDVSFISQTLIIPCIPEILHDEGIYIGLVKPQFECGKEALNKNGIVKDKKYHLAAICKVYDCLKENGLTPFEILPSPIFGGDGNTEFLIAAVYGNSKVCFPIEKCKNIVFG